MLVFEMTTLYFLCISSATLPCSIWPKASITASHHHHGDSYQLCWAGWFLSQDIFPVNANQRPISKPSWAPSGWVWLELFDKKKHQHLIKINRSLSTSLIVSGHLNWISYERYQLNVYSIEESASGISIQCSKPASPLEHRSDIRITVIDFKSLINSKTLI